MLVKRVLATLNEPLSLMRVDPFWLRIELPSVCASVNSGS